METLAYIHLVTTTESPEDVELTLNPFDPKWLEQLSWKKLPSSAWIHLGAITISLTVLSMASSSALALQTGNQGSQVMALQQQLKAAGYYDGTITGFYGSQTQAAVRRFQQAKGIGVDGIAGPKTLSALSGTFSADSNLAQAILLHRGDRGTTVTQLQTALKTEGFFNRPVTGYYGSITEEAVRRFQQSRGLRADGIAGSNTLYALGGIYIGRNIPTSTELRYGDTGSAVSQLQNRLKALGFYNADETGYYSRLTEQAVSDFQRSRGLSVNGIAGPTTLAALQNNSPGNSTTAILRRESRGAAVSQLQNRLKALGFFQANVTGYYGSLTEEAVRKFQRSRGLSVNGIAGPTTLAALQGNSPSNKPSYVATQTQLRYGDSGTAVAQLQNRLKALGFYKYEVTSYYGRLTEDAVSDFQRSRELSVNGIAGPTTLAALQGISPGSNSTAVAALQR